MFKLWNVSEELGLSLSHTPLENYRQTRKNQRVVFS